jgi:hypothetical protein
VQFVAPGTAGNVLTSNGTTWTSAATAASLIGQTNSASPFETSLGYQAGLNTTGTNNTFIGYECGIANTTGQDNTGLGYRALYTFSVTSGNTAIGSTALTGLTTGSNNVAVGSASSQSNQTGSFNVSVGWGAAFTSTAGSQYTAVGYRSLSQSTADNNTALGYHSGFATTTGAANTYIGVFAGDVVTTGSNNVIIGSSADASSSSVSSEIVVGASLVGKGTQTAYIGGTNGAYNAKNVTTWETTSDERIKRNIVDSPKGLAEVKQLRVCNFNYKPIEDMPLNAEGKPIIDNLDPNRLITGFIAQELQTVMPECVNTTASGLLSVSSDAIIYALVKAVQELAAEVEALKG